MDNTAKGFAQKVISELNGIRRLLHELAASVHQKYSPISSENAANRKQQQPAANALRTETRSNLRPTPEQTNKTDQEEEERWPWLTKNKPLVEAVGLFFVILYTTFAAIQSCEIRRSNDIAQKTFDAANRPYVGPGEIRVIYAGPSSNGMRTTTNKPNGQSDTITFNTLFENFGTVPARNAVLSWKVFLDKVRQRSTKIPATPGTFFPTQTATLRGTFTGESYTRIMREQQILSVEVSAEYDGPSAHYKECENFQFSPNANGFFDLGGCFP